MARPKGSTNKPKFDENGNPLVKAKRASAPKAARVPRVPKNEAGIGHNSEALDDDQFRALLMDAVGKIETQKEKHAKTQSELAKLYKVAKSDGIDKKDIDHAIKLRAQDPEQVRADAVRRAKITEWLHPGTQADLFGNVPARNRAYEDGKATGLEGKAGVTPVHFVSQSQDWLSGWEAGQAVLVSGISEIKEYVPTSYPLEDPIEDAAE